MKTFFITLILTVVIFASVKAQQSPVYSQYLFNNLVINPAYAGSHVQMSMTAMYRNQWVNLEGAPRTFSFSGHTSLIVNKIGVGLLIANDQIGSYSNTSMFGSYAYMIKLPAGVFAMGLQAGFNLTSVDFSSLNLDNPGDFSFSGFSNKIKPNFGTGLYFYNDHYHIGFSVPFILNNAIKGSFENAINEIKEARYYYLNAGANWPLNQMKTVKINPGFLIAQQEGAPLSIDVNLGFIFFDVFSVGASYRNIEGIVSYIDLKVSDRLHFGYSYDWTTSGLNEFSNGSHEFMLNYRFRISQIHGHVECPSYYKH